MSYLIASLKCVQSDFGLGSVPALTGVQCSWWLQILWLDFGATTRQRSRIGDKDEYPHVF